MLNKLLTKKAKLWPREKWGANRRFARTAMQETISKLGPYSGREALEDDSSPPPLGGRWKRAIDVAVAGVALLVLMPILIMTAVLIRLLTGESIIFCERLTGHEGRTFVGYKFRMPVGDANGASPWAKYLAEALRGPRLDQLPQFINVIRGEMSLIGPRPRTAAEFNEYFAQAPECLLARPGLISIWESHGLRFRDERTEIALDRCYVRNWSIRLDFALLRSAIFSTHRNDGAV